MNRIVMALPLVFGLMAFTPLLPPPIAPASEGKLLCIAPDIEQRTCSDLVRYTRSEDGVVWAHTVGLVEEDPLVTWKGTAPVEIKNDWLCERVRPEHAETFELTVAPDAGGRAFGAKVYKDFMVATARAIAHHDLCTAFVAGSGDIILKYMIDGVQSRMPDERAIWVAPEDGYRVAP